jgi:hypothetical protein
LSGYGTHQSRVTVAGRPFVTSYTGGVNTMTFAGQTLELSEKGTVLEIGSQTFHLVEDKSTIVIETDGTAKVKQE